MQTHTLPRAGGTVAKWFQICGQFPEVSALGPLRALSTVYYPVALLRMRLEEYSFEDFNAVEQSLLRFYSCGITRPEDLCRWMALPSVRYVRERLALLTAEGLIRGGTLTPLGEESLQLNQKKKLFDTEQIFQADAVTGLLLPKEYQADDRHLIDRTRTQSSIPHLAHSESIALETIRQAIQGPEKIRSYKRYRKSILNVNVKDVQDIQVREIQYIEALMAWPACSPAPLAFLPVHGRTEEGARRCDTPLCLPRSLASRLPELAQTTQTLPDGELDALNRLYDLVIADQRQLDMDSVARWLEENTAFQPRTVENRSDRIEAVLALRRTDNLTALDLEILAALGADQPVSVESEMSLRTRGGGTFRKRVAFWPSSAEALPARAAELARLWAQYSWKIGKAAPLSLQKALDMMNQSRREEE